MSETLSSFRRRLDKVDEQIASRKRRNELAKCNCESPRIIVHFSQTEQKNVEPCPVHGFDRLEHVIPVRFVSPDGPSDGKQLNCADTTS